MNLPQPLSRRRRMLAEGLGTGALVTVIVGSGIAARQLSPHDVGLQLLQNSIATALALTVLIWVFGPLSGAHLNPVVTVLDRIRPARQSMTSTPVDVLGYVAAQIAGAVFGAILANLMFDQAAGQIATQNRVSTGHVIGEIVAMAGLVLVIAALARTGPTLLIAPAVGAYIGAAYWFTSSTAFANPAVTIGRIFTDTFAGIDPASAAVFIGAQIIGAAVGLALITALFGSDPLPAGSTTSRSVRSKKASR